MSIEAVQKILVSTLVIGGLGGGFYALTGGSSQTLYGMHKHLGRELIENWEEIAEKYKQENQTDLIEGIKPTSSKLANSIKKWCDNKGSTYFIDATDKIYKSYSVWCLKEAQINTVLEKKGFKWDDGKWDKKLEKYNTATQSFITEGAKNTAIPKEKLKPAHISKWCEDNRIQRYKYQGEQTEYRVRSFCYWTDDELVEADKPKETAVPAQAPETR